MDKAPEVLKFTSNIELFVYLFVQELMKTKDAAFSSKEVKIESSDPNQYRAICPVGNTGEVVTVKFFELLGAVKVYVYDSTSSTFLSLNINVSRFLKPRVRNAFTIDSDKKLISYFHKELLLQKLRDLFNCRILNKLRSNERPEKAVQLSTLSKNHIIMIGSFLRRRDLLRFLSINSDFYKNYYSNNEFWMGLYHRRFRKSGFKIDQIAWKLTYLNKIK